MAAVSDRFHRVRVRRHSEPSHFRPSTRRGKRAETAACVHSASRLRPNPAARSLARRLPFSIGWPSPRRRTSRGDPCSVERDNPAVGVSPVLMMNDPDEARRLAMRQPAGGIVSLHELPDFVRLVAANSGPFK